MGSDDAPPSPFSTRSWHDVDGKAATTSTVSDADERRCLVAARSATALAYMEVKDASSNRPLSVSMRLTSST